jgi:hypothetical protein
VRPASHREECDSDQGRVGGPRESREGEQTQSHQGQTECHDDTRTEASGEPSGLYRGQEEGEQHGQHLHADGWGPSRRRLSAGRGGHLKIAWRTCRSRRPRPPRRRATGRSPGAATAARLRLLAMRRGNRRTSPATRQPIVAGWSFAMPTSLAISPCDIAGDIVRRVSAQRGRAMGAWAGCNGLAWIVRPTLGGVIVVMPAGDGSFFSRFPLTCWPSCCA